MIPPAWVHGLVVDAKAGDRAFWAWARAHYSEAAPRPAVIECGQVHRCRGRAVRVVRLETRIVVADMETHRMTTVRASALTPLWDRRHLFDGAPSRKAGQ